MTRQHVRPPTIAQVAKKAGVSISTVSRVMNGNQTVAADLVKRVQKVATELGYTASPVARSLVLGRTQTVAVVVPDLANPTFQAILHGLSRAAAVDDYHILIADSDEQIATEKLLAAETRRRTDGLILCAPRMSSEDLEALLPGVSPAVVINRPPQPHTPVVAADYSTGLRSIVQHIYQRGHRRVAYLAGSPHSTSNAARVAALDEATATHPDLQITEIAGGVDFDAGASAADDVLASEATAVLAFNDLVAMGLLSAVTDRGIQVPEQLSIAGFDDIPFARYTSPPLTSAVVPGDEIGATAWAAMHAQLTGTEPEAFVSVTPRIVVRGSTGRLIS